MTMSMEIGLWALNIAVEAALLLLLVDRRIWRTLPVFCGYCAWSLCSDIGMVLVDHFFQRAHIYMSAYLISFSGDAALEVGVLIELTWSILRPFRSTLPRWTMAWIALFTLAAGALLWQIPGTWDLTTMSSGFRFLLHFSRTTAILRVLFFLLLAGSSQWLSIGWRDRELQVTTGLGFYSFVSLVVEVIHSHMKWGDPYVNLNRIVVASYTCSLLYWFYCFTQKEVQRHEFSPQMMRVLTTLAGTARSTRLSLGGPDSPSRTENRKP